MFLGSEEMKKGFALLETIIVVTVLAVSLLMLYGTFLNMVNNSKRNILYDDVSNIYITYYVKEYLSLKDLNINEDINEIQGYEELFGKLNINKVYVTKYDLKNINIDKYGSMFKEYVKSLSNKDNFKYRLIVEFKNNEEYSYANVGFNYE